MCIFFFRLDQTLLKEEKRQKRKRPSKRSKQFHRKLCEEADDMRKSITQELQKEVADGNFILRCLQSHSAEGKIHPHEGSTVSVELIFDIDISIDISLFHGVSFVLIGYATSHCKEIAYL